MIIKNDDQLKAVKAMVLTLSYANHSLFTYGMKLAMENELQDLKGLIDPQSNTGSEFDLLESLADPVVRLALDSIEHCDNLIRVLLKQNELKRHLVLSDTECSHFASDIFYEVVYDLDGTDYLDFVVETDLFHGQLILVLYLLCRVYMGDPIDLQADCNYTKLQDEFYSLNFEQSIKIGKRDRNLSVVYDYMRKLDTIRWKVNNWIR